jgi:phospholipase/lecithinase/hemolysin
MLDTLAASNSSLTIHRLDVAALFSQAIANPAAFGLANVTNSAAPGLQPGASSYNTSLIAPNANQYLFWDDLHPTATVHAELAQYALQQLMLPGDINRDGRVNVADVAAMMAALADLSGYEATHSLANQQLVGIFDMNGDNKVTNTDIQGLTNLLANGGGSGSGGGATNVVPEPSPLILIALSALGLRVMTGRAKNRKLS